MDFILITGPQAVGKMAVGKALAQKTGLKLFHNHMSIELVLQLFDFHTPEAQKLIRLFRREIFEAMASSQQKGMIFTYVWAFDMPSDGEYVASVLQLFEEQGANTYIVELEADLEARIHRNSTPLRLQEKPTKRNLEWSHQDLVSSLEKYRLNSDPGEIDHRHYLRIDNTQMTPEEVADSIIHNFGLL